MPKELELWCFIADKLRNGQHVTLLIVVHSRGSSPGRAGYKMAVATDGELCGSVGGGRMEVDLVERAKMETRSAEVLQQVHRKNSPNASGMICSGEQTVIFKPLFTTDLPSVELAERSLSNAGTYADLTVSGSRFLITLGDPPPDIPISCFEQQDADFLYKERLGPKQRLCIIGGGHCALALSELMSKLDFSISIFDDRPSLNTLEKNRFADNIQVIERYEEIDQYVAAGADVYVVVMTLGYASDAVVIRQLLDKDFKYFGVLGSNAKMAMLLRELKDEGHDPERLAQLHTPIGIQINSHTPEEIAISIAAEIISLKNAE